MSKNENRFAQTEQSSAAPMPDQYPKTFPTYFDELTEGSKIRMAKDQKAWLNGRSEIDRDISR